MRGDMDTAEPLCGCRWAPHHAPLRDIAEIEANLLAGQSGVSLVTRFPTGDYPSRIAAQLRRPLHLPASDVIAFSARPPLDQLAHWCVESALRDAGLLGVHREANVGLVLGIGAEWMFHWGGTVDPNVVGMRLYDPEQDRDSTIERVHRELGLLGPALGLSAACASGNHALEIGRHWLRLGLVDICVVGACDLAVTPIGLATFGNLRALSRRNADPAGASRPFDRDRDGFVLGEGGVALRSRPRTRPACSSRRGARLTPKSPGCGQVQ